MMQPVLVAVVVEHISSAENGVDYSPRHGALCPSCHGRAKIYKTMPWDGTVRIRYHRCHTSGCLICSMGTTIKSIEVDHG